jgi:hypothetical protein
VYFPFLCLVWCPRQNKTIAPLSFFYGYRKDDLRINSIYIWDRRRWAYHLSRLQYYLCLNNFGKTWVSRRSVWVASAAPSRIKRERYVCICMNFPNECSCKAQSLKDKMYYRLYNKLFRLLITLENVSKKFYYFFPINIAA